MGYDMDNYDQEAIEVARAAAAADHPDTLEALDGHLRQSGTVDGLARIDGAIPEILLAMLEIGRHAWDYVRSNPAETIEIGAATIKVATLIVRRGDLSNEDVKTASAAALKKAEELAARKRDGTS